MWIRNAFHATIAAGYSLTLEALAALLTATAADMHSNIFVPSRRTKMEENRRILIAHPNETLRQGLCAIFDKESACTVVGKIATNLEFKARLTHGLFDLIVLHQSFATNEAMLPRGKFVLLANEPDVKIYFFALSNGALAYLMENTPCSLLRQTLHLESGAFLIDPVISKWLQEYLAHHSILSISDTGLSPREQEILHLLWQGSNRHDVAQRLGIAESTVRSHTTHIHQKLQLNREQMTILSKLLGQDQQ